MDQKQDKTQRPSIRFNCPMPQLDFDKITLGHGGGGSLTHRLLKEGVFNLFSNKWLDEEHDGAILDLQGRVAFSTDSFVVSPLFFPGGNIGDLAVNGTVNDVAMCGGLPQYISLGFILEEGLPIDTFWDILVSIREACRTAGVAIVTGDTKVVEKGKGDGLFINTTGIGKIHPEAAIAMDRINVGDKIIVSGKIATHGVVILSLRQGIEFQTNLMSDTQPLHSIIYTLLDEFGQNIRFFRDPTRGGVASAMNEVAWGTGLGIELQESSIPIHGEVKGACEMLGLDPLYVANEGVFLMIVADEVAEAALQRLKTGLNCPDAAIIGQVCKEPMGKVLLKGALGGRRVVAMMPGEQLPRIC